MNTQLSLGMRKLIAGIVCVLGLLLVFGWLASDDFTKLVTAVLM